MGQSDFSVFYSEFERKTDSPKNPIFPHLFSSKQTNLRWKAHGAHKSQEKNSTFQQLYTIQTGSKVHVILKKTEIRQFSHSTSNQKLFFLSFFLLAITFMTSLSL